MLKDLRKRTNGSRFPRARLFWVRPGRCNEWRHNFITQRVTAEEWKKNFRMNRETFLKLCDDLRPSLEGQDTRMRMPLSVEKQVFGAIRLVSILGRFCSYNAEVFFMSKRKAVRYSVDIALFV